MLVLMLLLLLIKERRSLVRRFSGADWKPPLLVALAQLGSAACARRRRQSAKSRRNIGLQLERMEACLGRWFHRLPVQSLRRCLAALPALPRRFSRYPAVAMPSPLRAWSRR